MSAPNVRGRATANPTTSANVNVALPAGSAVDDLCTVVIECDKTYATTPTGFTSHTFNNANANSEIRLAYKLLVAGDITNNFVTMPGDPNFNGKRYDLEFYWDTSPPSIDVAAANQGTDGTGTNSVETFSSITTTQANTLRKQVAGGRASGTSWASPPAGNTTRQNNPGGYHSMYSGDQTQAAAGASGTATVTNNGAAFSRWCTMNYAVTGAAGGGSVSATGAGTSATSGTATALVEHPVTAAGTSPSSSTAAGGVSHDVTAAGTTTTTASAAAGVDHPATGTGISATSGTATSVVEHPVTASGTSPTVGAVSAVVEHAVTAGGASATSGSATATVAASISATAAGSSATTGTATATPEVLATATGSSSTTGTAAATVTGAGQATGNGTSPTSGTASALVEHMLFAAGITATTSTAVATVARSATGLGSALTLGTASSVVEHAVTAAGASATSGSAAAATSGEIIGGTGTIGFTNPNQGSSYNGQAHTATVTTTGLHTATVQLTVLNTADMEYQ